MSYKKCEWEWKKLGDVCDIISGRNQKAVEEPDGEYPIYGSGGEMGRASDFICPAGCTIVGRKGSINNPIFVNEPFWNVDTAFGFSPKSICNPFFLFYFCKSFDFYSMNKGTTIPSLVKADLLEISIPIPPLAEQERIVKVLDDAFAKIDKIKTDAETNLQNAKDLFDAELRKTFDDNDWEIKKLEDVCTITSSKRIFKDEYVKKGIPFYRTKEIKELSHGEPISLELFISKERYESIKNQFGVPQIGDVLISAVGTIGEILVITNDDPFYFKDGNIIWMKDIKETQSEFLKYLLTSVVEKLKAMTRGAAYNALTIEKFKEQEISLPPLSIQKQIVAKLDSLSEKVKQLESNYKQVIADCDELKKSILKKAFNGEL